MSSPFDNIAAAAGTICDSIMGEMFDIFPMTAATDVNARPGADTDRGNLQSVLMVWGEPSARAHSGAVQTPGVRAEQPGHASARPFVSLQLSRVPYRLRSGDQIVRRKTGTRYRIAEPLPSTPGFARLDLNEIR